MICPFLSTPAVPIECMAERCQLYTKGNCAITVIAEKEAQKVKKLHINPAEKPKGKKDQR